RGASCSSSTSSRSSAVSTASSTGTPTISPTRRDGLGASSPRSRGRASASKRSRSIRAKQAAGATTGASRRSSSCTRAGSRLPLAHEALAGSAHERDRLGEEHAHGVAKRDCLLVDAALRLYLSERRGGELDGGVERQRRELLALRFLHVLGLLLGELA